MGTFRTVSASSRFAPEPTKGSRFIATVAPASSDAEALAAIHEVERALSDASHHCWAWRLRDGRARSSDAGEPGGSAGRPILAQVEGHGAYDVVVVVSRWFGGTKLGVGGLVRAYGGAAGMALDRAGLVARVDTVDLVITHDYGDTNAVEAIVHSEHLERISADYADLVRVTVRVPADDRDRIVQLLTDRSSGRVRVESPRGPRDAAVGGGGPW